MGRVGRPGNLRPATLVQICDNVWGVETQIRLMPWFWLPLRSTVVKLPDGTLWIHAPFAMEEELWQQIEALGEVRHLVAPNGFHSGFLKHAQRRFPRARVWVSPRLPHRNLRLTYDRLLQDGARPEEWGEALDVRLFRGAPGAGEMVFLHRSTCTLIVTDLVFNIHGARGLARLYLKWSKALGRVGQSRLWRFLVKDRNAAADSGRALIDSDFTRIVMAHGDVVHGGGREALSHALAWLHCSPG